jgi:drug/metabolite transporter (DMT)-like permease
MSHRSRSQSETRVPSPHMMSRDIVYTCLGRSLYGGLRVQDWLWLLLFVAAAQGGQLLFAWAHRQVDATVSSLLLLGETPITAAAAYVFLGEPVTWLMAVGGAIALTSLGLIVRRATRAGNEVKTTEGAPP